VGEVTSTGVHGANRLASSSLLECLVFGAQFAVLGKAFQRQNEFLPTAQSEPKPIQVEEWQKDEAILDPIHQSLPVLMWNNAGICRDAERLESAIAQVQDWRHKFGQLGITQRLTTLPIGVTLTLPSVQISKSIRRWAETQNLLDNAYLILKSALFRTESRGGHYRIEYPNTDQGWQVHTLVQGEDWSKSQPIQTQEFGD
jgi:L-aspartate oxidase